MITLTLEDLKAMKKEFITPAEASSVTGYSADKIREYARAGIFKFPVIAPNKPGARVLIGRVGFINWYENKEEKPEEPDLLLQEVHALNTALAANNALLMILVTKFAPDVGAKATEGGTAQ